MGRNETNAKKRKRQSEAKIINNGTPASIPAVVDTSKPTAVFQPGKGRDWTVSVAVAGSIISNAQSHELRTSLAGQIARALSVFCVDEVVVFADGNSQSNPAKRHHNRTHSNGHQTDPPQDEYTGTSDPDHFLIHLLSYLESPPHLRRYLFPLHPNLRTAGTLPSLDLPHHLRADEWCPYREGVTLPGADERGTFVEAGLRIPVTVEDQIPENTRVTLKFVPGAEEASKNTKSEEIKAEPVSPDEPREESGYYWGFTVRKASCLSDVFTECTYDGGYDITIGTSERGVDVETLYSGTDEQQVGSFKHLLIVFGGVAGLEVAVKNDAELQKLSVVEAKNVFDRWIDVCPGQGSRTIRTEEAVWIGLMDNAPRLSDTRHPCKQSEGVDLPHLPPRAIHPIDNYFLCTNISSRSLPMAEELSLPKLAWNPITESFSNSRSRKRVRSSPPVSSDPAIFSSDDDPSADNYTQDRRKRKYRGPWYQQQPASDAGSQDIQVHDLKKGKRTFERQYDSGIFMGSDGTDIDEPMENLDLSKKPKLSLRQTRPIAMERATQPLEVEELAAKEIHRCLEEGDESIDLSSKGLTTLSNATIRPLATFTCVPPVIEGVFSQLEPSLKIFLSANQLRTLPGELFNLESLAVLTLRANSFHELPPAIGNLHNLKELNVSQNRLRYLPFEILELFSVGYSLESPNLHPNPFFEPRFPPGQEQADDIHYKIGLGTQTRTRPRRGAVSCVSPGLGQRSWHPRWKVTYKTRTETRYLDSNGALLQGPIFPDFDMEAGGSVSKSIPVVNPYDAQTAPQPRGNILSRAPSLLEVSLRACSQVSQLPNLPSFLPEDSPKILSDLLAKAIEKKESSGSKCTICNRNFIIARTEWIEWWEIAKILDHKTLASMASAASPLRQKENERDVLESMVPLMRRGCSWMCVPAKVEVVERPDEMDMDE
ncbi:hypothetical protein G7Y89_g5348 [Cudoniella acicularis]|uniref:Uncharacterized protein n=1 Tax=Cudoniella acicularis TaxID=354080 RepID=A0A8H4RPR7_9HELO|nr:hypothetical protein G7Y89_g5348 [Cudoniella acicularis]